ncbi:hypothetical protein NP233_g3624 [Leucocoprinus birnbaumii]|uniref:F-box domain-containing protein n=1 Tax=Leucocoprinus birnbaumii TaxID=56174 RepID=A0AAD5VWQ6_9AGAR|nr:hypothetical protein NP233_g3624 [Leucocoprinus birnbaumii]
MEPQLYYELLHLIISHSAPETLKPWRLVSRRLLPVATKACFSMLPSNLPLGDHLDVPHPAPELVTTLVLHTAPPDRGTAMSQLFDVFRGFKNLITITVSAPHDLRLDLGMPLNVTGHRQSHSGDIGVVTKMLERGLRFPSLRNLAFHRTIFLPLLRAHAEQITRLEFLKDGALIDHIEGQSDPSETPLPAVSEIWIDNATLSAFLWIPPQSLYPAPSLTTLTLSEVDHVLRLPERFNGTFLDVNIITCLTLQYTTRYDDWTKIANLYPHLRTLTVQFTLSAEMIEAMLHALPDTVSKLRANQLLVAVNLHFRSRWPVSRSFTIPHAPWEMRVVVDT